MRRVCIFCGSSPGARPAYAEATAELARELVADGIGVVYGGGAVGLMGVLADTVLAHGGEALGVIPRALVDKEIGHDGLSDLRVVGSMHERKALMADLSDGFVALPGGLGTLEELFEVYTWAQLGLHRKPCGLLDVEGYYAGIADFLAHAVEERFLREEHRAMLAVERDPRELIERLRAFRPDTLQPKWIDREEIRLQRRDVADGLRTRAWMPAEVPSPPQCPSPPWERSSSSATSSSTACGSSPQRCRATTPAATCCWSGC